jgi:hypothetical protein
VLAQHFGSGGEFNRIGQSGVVSEAGFAASIFWSANASEPGSTPSRRAFCF